MVSFKLETDEGILLSKVQKSFKENSSDLIVANTLQTRNSQVSLYKRKEGELDKPVVVSLDGGSQTIEDKLVSELLNAI